MIVIVDMLHDNIHFSVMQYSHPAQEVRQVTFAGLREVNTDTAQLLTTEGERICHQNHTANFYRLNCIVVKIRCRAIEAGCRRCGITGREPKDTAETDNQVL